MEVENTPNIISNSEPIYFIALDEKNQEYTIKLDIDNNFLIFEILNEDDINFLDKKYISKNSYDSLKQNQIIFSDYNTLEEMKKLLENIIRQEDNFLKCKIKKEIKKYILTIPVSFINQINFDLIEEEKDMKDLIKRLLIDNNKKTEEIKQLKKELSLTKELLNNLNNEINLFHGSGTFYICSALDPKKCIDIKPSNDHWYLVINDFNKKNTQKFIVKITKDANDHCITNFYENKIVSVDNANTENGSKILMDENINFENNQLWFFVKYGEYICIRYKKDSQKVIDIPNENLSNGNELIIWDFNGNMNQLWKFIDAE